MTKKAVSSILCVLFSATCLLGQTVTLSGSFNRFITYYVTSVDINTGSSDIQLFDYLLECVDCARDVNGRYSPPVSANITFKMSIRSPMLGIDPEETIAFIYTTKPFVMKAPIPLDNRDFTIETKELYDIYGDTVRVSIDIDEDRTLDISKFEDMFSVIVQTGRLPDGIYRFRLTIDPVGGTGDVVEEVINVTTPTTLQLTSPGGPFDQIEQNNIYTVYPVFQWESEMFTQGWVENCPDCGFFIRVAEFRCEDHATIEEAIEDVTNLPLDQTLGWQLVGDEAPPDGQWQPGEVSGNQLTFMYPTTGAVDLRPGGIYVWQIQKRLSTTEGIERINSPIYAFYVEELTVDPIMQALEEILPEEVLSNYITPCGPLTGYAPTGTLKLDGIDSDISTLNAVIEEFRQGRRTLITSEVR